MPGFLETELRARLVDRANVASRLHRAAGLARAPGTRTPGACERQPSRALPHAFVHDNLSRVPWHRAAPRRREGRQHRVTWPQVPGGGDPVGMRWAARGHAGWLGGDDPLGQRQGCLPTEDIRTDRRRVRRGEQAGCARRQNSRFKSWKRGVLESQREECGASRRLVRRAWGGFQQSSGRVPVSPLG